SRTFVTPPFQFFTMIFRRLSFFCIFSATVLLSACKKEEPATPQPAPNAAPPAQALPPKPGPAFNADRALAEVDTQVSFGPRVPNSAGHDEEVEWLQQALLQCTPNVSVQAFTHQGYDEVLSLRNIVASFNPQATWRILIVTHFDSRPRADEDPDPSAKSQ